MAHEIHYSHAAARQLRKLSQPVQDRIRRTALILAETPRPPKSIKMAGTGNQWRVRTGDYRIVYEIHDDELLVLVIKIGHRRSVYR